MSRVRIDSRDYVEIGSFDYALQLMDSGARVHRESWSNQNYSIGAEDLGFDPSDKLQGVGTREDEAANDWQVYQGRSGKNILRNLLNL